MVALTGLALAGCGSGRHNQQYLERSVVNGTSTSIEGLSIRSAYIIAPVSKGGTATVSFAMYADTPAAATQLVRVTSQQLAGAVPAELSTVTAGVPKLTNAVTIDYQSGPGANGAAAMFRDVAVNVASATYFSVTFTFANSLTQTLDVPVAQIGQVDPLSSGLPTSFPEQPFPLSTTLPGEAVASSAP